MPMAIHSIEEYFGDIFKQLVETEEVSAVDIIAVQIENSNTIPQMIQVIYSKMSKFPFNQFKK